MEYGKTKHFHTQESGIGPRLGGEKKTCGGFAAALFFFRAGWPFHIKRRTTKQREGLSWSERCFHFYAQMAFARV